MNRFPAGLATTLMLALVLAVGCSADQPPEEPVEAAKDAATEAAVAVEEAAEAVAEAAESLPPSEVPATNEEPPPDEDIVVAQTEVTSEAAAPTPARPAPYRVGDHYSLLSPAQPTSVEPGKIEVTEVFMYGCPHCYNFQAFVEKWLPQKASYIELVRVPALFNRPAKIHARAFYTAETLGVLEQSHLPFFRELHASRRQLVEDDELAAFYAKFGVDGDTFRKTFNSFAVDTKLRRAESIGRRYRVTSTPTVIVHGKYVIDGDKISTYEEILKVADYLAAKEAGGG